MLTDHSTSAPSPRKTEPFAAIPHTACISDLSDAAYRVLGAVLFFARRGSCDATDQQLGARCGKSAPAIQRSLKELEAKGWIERLGSGGPFRVLRLRSPEDPTCSEVIRYPLGSDQVPPRKRSGTCSEVIRYPLRSDQEPDQIRAPLKKGEGEQSEERRESSPVPGRGPTTPAADGDEDEVAELERLVAAGGPVARMARARLAELGAGVAAAGGAAEAAPRA